MKELSIFIDESGDFGEYSSHAPYYLITFVFHEQNLSIKSQLESFEKSLRENGYPKDFYIHTGPVIRKEYIFNKFSLRERRFLISKLFSFFRKTKVSHKTFIIKKNKELIGEKLTKSFIKQISDFISENIKYFVKFDEIKIYYDRGQKEVTRIIKRTFCNNLGNVNFKDDVKPESYKLFQIADLICTLNLISIKFESNNLSKSERIFFESKKKLQNNYLKPLSKQEF